MFVNLLFINIVRYACLDELFHTRLTIDNIPECQYSLLWSLNDWLSRGEYREQYEQNRSGSPTTKSHFLLSSYQ